MPTSYGERGAVCTVDALASTAGLELLKRGGSAVDAAVGANAVLAVTTQHMCGMGGDVLGVVHPGRGSAPRSLLAVGRAGSGADAGAMRAEGLTAMPFRDDVRSVTVPGCVDGWLALHEAYGRLPLGDVLAAAVHFAVDGFPVAPLLAAALPRVAQVDAGDDLGPRAAGEVLGRPRLGQALRDIADGGREAWYGGDFGRGLLRVGGGLFTADDLVDSCAEWSEPLSLKAFGWQLHGTPAPSSSYLALAGAAVGDRLGLAGADPDDPRVAHLLVEASRAVGHDRRSRLHDGATGLLDPADLDRRTAAIRDDQAAPWQVPGTPGGTIFLVAADADGMAVSLGNSNAAGFGAHVAVPEVGVFLHNRGIGFSLLPGSPDELAPGRRPPHTLSPLLLTDEHGDWNAVLGSMGGDAQPQVLLQLLARLRAGASAADAVDAPRWSLAGREGTGFDTWDVPSSEQHVRVEAGASYVDGLRQRGHRVVVADPGAGFGHAHVITRSDGGLAAATDGRALTGAAAVW